MDIEQIAPATNTVAGFRDQHGVTEVIPVIAWALTPYGDVLGLVASGSKVEVAQHRAGFVGYRPADGSGVK